MAESFSFFGGVDFSGAKEPLSNLWTAVGRDDGGKLRILSLRPHAFRADLGAFVGDGWRAIAGADPEALALWGVNFPFGFPEEATRHLLEGSAEWERLIAWVADRPPDEVRGAVPEALRAARVTDGGIAPSPFDLRLYKQVVEGIRWLHDLRDRVEVSVHPQAPRPDACTLVEVNAAATVQELGLPRRRAPGRAGETRARAAALRTFLCFDHPEQEATAVTLEDAWDAVVSCLTAYLAREDLDQPYRLHPLRRTTIGTEGWIYRAPATL